MYSNIENAITYFLIDISKLCIIHHFYSQRPRNLWYRIVVQSPPLPSIVFGNKCCYLILMACKILQKSFANIFMIFLWGDVVEMSGWINH